ncbi:hypothetical protein [Pseudonocardia sp. TRM90224]|uniref:hypothetical protein n=1 Tax=Pseudonocardia sp. TRM90224 TaxID=2812678 RepID=UPI001E36FA7C|nr:hypothetical protein [Pseudonocardia sp. TRM90224]
MGVSNVKKLILTVSPTPGGACETGSPTVHAVMTSDPAMIDAVNAHIRFIAPPATTPIGAAQ